MTVDVDVRFTEQDVQRLEKVAEDLGFRARVGQLLYHQSQEIENQADFLLGVIVKVRAHMQAYGR